MRICILTQYYPPEIGAPQVRLSELTSYLVNNGYRLNILTAIPNYPTGKIFQGYGGLYMKENIDGIPVVRTYIYPTNSIKLIPRLLNYFSFVLSSLFVGSFLLPKFDILITESPPLFLGISGYFLSKVKGAKWIFNVSDLWPESAVNLGVIGDGPSLRLSKILEVFCYKNSWFVTCQSREIMENINERFPQVTTYRLSNGVNIKKFNPQQESNILDQWANGKKYTAVYAGLHGIAQGLEQIIKTAAKIEKNSPELQIILIGDGPEKTQLKNYAEELSLSNLTFVEPQTNESMPTIWASADIALISLKQYIPGAVPSKLYEAMSSATPILMVGEGEPVNIVNTAQCGISVIPGDINSIATALETLINDINKRKNFGKNGRSEVKKNFNRKVILNEFSQFLLKNVSN